MDPTEETKEQFMARYSTAAGFPDIFETHKIALPCDCDDGGGPNHWAAILRDPEFIADHLQFHAPEGTPWPEGIDNPDLTNE